MKLPVSFGTLPDVAVVLILKHVVRGGKVKATLNALLQQNRLWRHHAHEQFYAEAMISLPYNSLVQFHARLYPPLTGELFNGRRQLVKKLHVFIDVCAILAGTEDLSAMDAMCDSLEPLLRAQMVSFDVVYTDPRALLGDSEEVHVAVVPERVKIAVEGATEFACRIAPNAIQVSVRGNTLHHPRTDNLRMLHLDILDRLAQVLARAHDGSSAVSMLAPRASLGWHHLQEITMVDAISPDNSLELIRRNAPTLLKLYIGQTDNDTLDMLLRSNASSSSVNEYPQLKSIFIGCSFGVVDAVIAARAVCAFPRLRRLTHNGDVPASLLSTIEERAPHLSYLWFHVNCPLAVKLVAGRMLDSGAFASLRCLYLYFDVDDFCDVYRRNMARIVECLAQMCPRLAMLHISGLRGDVVSSLPPRLVFPPTLRELFLPMFAADRIETGVQFEQAIKAANPHLTSVKFAWRTGHPGDVDVAAAQELQ
ncbi:hypothetical protein H4R21_000318 [Coemansia helicoidea]|uniref:Uncharacterized protein n=1 Tax=Coemansia helicoidea TaxID=1286919 RepID=A0ACC1LGT9_9FUNG|nr:hypothetical protein H4R21_000318 [Coemansia helicoidea]